MKKEIGVSVLYFAKQCDTWPETINDFEPNEYTSAATNNDTRKNNLHHCELTVEQILKYIFSPAILQSQGMIWKWAWN